MNNWENRALALLAKSLFPIPSEINELDWKTDISNNSNRIAQHLSAFAQLSRGGFLVFGIDNSGKIVGTTKDQADEILLKLNNIARNNLAFPVSLDHTITNIEDRPILIVHVLESENKPINLRGQALWESYKRSAGNTVKMSPQEIKIAVSQSINLSFEEQIAMYNVSQGDILKYINFSGYFKMTNQQIPDQIENIVLALEREDFIKQNPSGLWDITNLGAILFCTEFKDFKELERKAPRVIIYNGSSKINAIREQVGTRGYATAFHGLINYIMEHLPTNEVIESAIRRQIKLYPEVALREFVANALIHQEFYKSGTSVMIEVYTDRIEITNPGIPLVDTDRFIDTPPQSRNEKLASMLRRLNICEERGSGIDRAIGAIEAFQLPAPKFEKVQDFTKVTIYAHRPLSKMSSEEKIRACYQHACLMYVSNQEMSNLSLRARFNIEEKNYPIASRIITETINASLIKPVTQNKKVYVPYWA